MDRTPHLLPLLLVALLGLSSVAWGEQRCHYRSPGYLPDRFEPRADGTVYDRATDLVWARCDLGQRWDGRRCSGYAELRSWPEALQAVARFNEQEAAAARPADWRLPNLKELASLINYHCSAPAVFDALMDPDGAGPRWRWSATPDVREVNVGEARETNQAWAVDFYLGYLQRLPIDQALGLRLVRGGTP